MSKTLAPEFTSHEESKRLALLDFLRETEGDELELGDIECYSYDDSSFDTPNGEYLVYLDEEADDAVIDSIESFISECIEPLSDDVPYASYWEFDKEAFIKDCKMDGRGFRLSGYDGNEMMHEICHEVKGSTDTNKIIYYIYRVV